MEPCFLGKNFRLNPKLLVLQASAKPTELLDTSSKWGSALTEMKSKFFSTRVDALSERFIPRETQKLFPL